VVVSAAVSAAEETARAEEVARQLEERQRRFREMLAERALAPFTPWKKVAPQLVTDPRYMALGSEQERRQVFESFMRSQLTLGKHADRKAQRRAQQEAFVSLLEELEERFTHATTYEELEHMARHDERWALVEAPHDRLALFAAKVTPLKEAQARRIEAAKAEFRALLLERADVVHADSHWSKASEHLRSDARYHRDLLSSADREELFRTHLKELVKARDADKLRRKREEASKAERERAVRSERAEQDSMLRTERARLQRDKETSDYRALLAETVHSARIAWADVRTRLAKDTRDRTSELTRDDKERLFRERVAQLHDGREDEFRAMLQRLPSVELDATWRDVRSRVRSDARFDSVTSEARREELFALVLDELRGEAEAELRTLFLSCPKITAETPLEGAEYELLHDMLRGDLRWQRFEVVPKKRKELLAAYIRDLRLGKVSLPSDVRRI